MELVLNERGCVWVLFLKRCYHKPLTSIEKMIINRVVVN